MNIDLKIKSLFRIGFLSLFLAIITTQVFSQPPELRFAKSYFKIEPYTTNFDVFLKKMLADTSIKNRDIVYKTDTTLFTLIGDYIKFNPFFFKPNNIEVSFREEEVRFEFQKGLVNIDTIFIYEILAIADTSEKGLKAVKNEFARIKKRNQRKFFETKYFDQLDNTNAIVGGTQYFYSVANRMSPCSVTWGKIQNKSAALSVQLRFIVRNNQVPISIEKTYQRQTEYYPYNESYMSPRSSNDL